MMHVRINLLYCVAISSMLACLTTALRADEPQTPPIDRPQIELIDITVAETVGRAVPLGSPRGGVACPGPFNATHTDTPFDVTGSSVFAQGGFLEGEWAAATYVIPADRFPLILEVGEIVFASPTITAPSQTTYSFAVWEGNPATGTIVAQFASNGADIPHADHPLGQNVSQRIQFSVDPSDPDQIVINNDGSNSFSVGFRVDSHNMQLFGSCGIACNEPLNLLCTGNNMMPATDTDGQAEPNNNWLFAISCPGLSAGWYNFTQLSGLGLTLSGDWMIQASYRCINEAIGACCLTSSCVQQTVSACSTLGGVYQGNSSLCINVQCPIVGACCQEDGSCSLEEGDFACNVVGGTYQGDGIPCDPTPCPQPGACCLPNGTCLDLTEATCNDIGFNFRGEGTECVAGGFCPIGACCLPDGSCTDGLGVNECSGMGGNYQGNGSLCVNVSCPQPTGACCVASSNTCIGGQTEANCLIIPTASWGGPQSFCPDACNTDPCSGLTPGDFDSNATIDGVDLALFAAAMIDGNPTPAQLCAGDFDGSQQLDTGDIQGMVAALLQ